MTAKRLDDRAVFLAIALFLGLPLSVSAQYSGGEWRLPAGAVTGPTKAVQAEPKPQVVIVQPTYYPRSTVFRRFPGGGHNPYARPYGGASVIPAVVLDDGSIFANFGYGYERVFRSCSGGGAVVRQPVVGSPLVVGSNGVVLSPVPTYTQPVPNQQTSSQQMAARVTGHPSVSVPAQAACFNRDGAGRVFVVRY